MSAVVVTGLGTVLAPGAGPAALEAALRTGEPVLAEVDTTAGFHARRSARRAALASGVPLDDWLPARLARRMSWPSRFAVAAATMALDGAGLPRSAPGEEAWAAVIATAFGTARYAEELVRQILLQGPQAASPFHFSESVANAPAAQVAIALGARGANVAVTQREAGTLLAVALAAREIERGRAPLALAGGSEEINPLVHAALGRFRALAPPDAEGREQARPFDRDRRGMIAAEGATVVAVETEERAAARGARVLARVRACERGFDATAPTHGWGTGAAALAARLRAGLARQGLDPADLGVVVSGASGARAGDSLEASILRELFAGEPPPVLAPKAVTGEYAGGQLAAAVLLAAGTPAWPAAGFATPDPGLGLAPWPGGELPPWRYALVSTLAAGGAAAWLVLERPDAD